MASKPHSHIFYVQIFYSTILCPILCIFGVHANAFKYQRVLLSILVCWLMYSFFHLFIGGIADRIYFSVLQNMPCIDLSAWLHSVTRMIHKYEAALLYSWTFLVAVDWQGRCKYPTSSIFMGYVYTVLFVSYTAVGTIKSWRTKREFSVALWY